MASVIRRYDKRKIPPDAEIIMRKGRRMVRFKDKRERTQIEALSEDRRHMMVEGGFRCC
jgi:hypothetical protein